MKGPMLICFFTLKGSTLRKIPSFLSLHQPRTSNELPVYFGDVHDVLMFTMFITCQLASFRM